MGNDRPGPDPPTAEARASAGQLAAMALRRVQEPASGRVRVEDYLTVLASITGEAAFMATGVIDIETSDIPPGAPVFGDPVNHLLSDDTTNIDEVTPHSVVGTLVAELVPATASLADFGSLDAIYRTVVAGVGKQPWGQVATTVPNDNRPTVLPLRVAFEARPAVEAALASSGLQPHERHVLCALALASGLRQVSAAIDIRLALTLALEVTFGVAKMMPMSRSAFARASENGAADS